MTCYVILSFFLSTASRKYNKGYFIFLVSEVEKDHHDNKPQQKTKPDTHHHDPKPKKDRPLKEEHVGIIIGIQTTKTWSYINRKNICALNI